MKLITVLFAAFIAVHSFAQTWPAKDCIDTPYTKNGSDIIYHTGNCAVKDTAVYVWAVAKPAPKKQTLQKKFLTPAQLMRQKDGTYFCPACNGYYPDSLHILRIIRDGTLYYEDGRMWLKETREQVESEYAYCKFVVDKRLKKLCNYDKVLSYIKPTKK